MTLRERIAAIFICAMAIVSCAPAGEQLPAEIDEILKNIKVPEFRAVDYNAVDFGAVADGVTDCRAAINDAITKCSDEGGGRVVLPQGKVFSKGCINIKSNVNLHIPEGCELIFSADPLDYLPGEPTVWEGTELFNYASFIRSYHCNNIAITGKGIINGNAKTGFAQMRPQRSAQQDTLRQMGIDLVPVRDRYFGERSILPPNMIEPFGCKNILIEDVTILDSPYWIIHPLFCDNVTVRRVTIDSWNRNNDGCDPEYTTNVLIEDCVFNTGDDAIAIKAGRDQDAWRIGQKTANIIIRNCEFSSKCNGLCIGSEMAAGVENVYMYNVHVGECHTAIYFKSNLDRGGFIRNVWVNNVTSDHVRTAFIRFENNYHGGRGGNYPTTFENFTLKNIYGKDSDDCGFYAVGVEGHPIKNVVLENVTFDKTEVPYVLLNTEDVYFRNVSINGEVLPEVPADTEKIKLKLM